ncbi:molybdopterin molybdenumtransferase MoeA, partial [Corallococcus exiguus]|nr:molybdopterin molybdenumtransferase MoeA [Corallococcus exiguus]
MALISVEEALRRVLAGVETPVGAEPVALSAAAARTLAGDLAADRDQPPFPASAMDGYAVRSADASRVPARLPIVGTSAAGRRFTGALGAGQAVRIFTGAPVPDGADAIVLQEDTDRVGDEVVIKESARAGRHIRPAGLDFRAGDV